jgi:hypothetical protein
LNLQNGGDPNKQVALINIQKGMANLMKQKTSKIKDEDKQERTA